MRCEELFRKKSDMRITYFIELLQDEGLRIFSMHFLPFCPLIGIAAKLRNKTLIFIYEIVSIRHYFANE